MFVVLSLLACSGGGTDASGDLSASGLEAPVVPLTATDDPLPEPRLGVSEVVTPPEVLRPTEVQDGAAPPQLDIWFDPDVTTFDAMRARLVGWGFSILDGDGESWRVGVPRGSDWPARLLPLPEVARVTEAIDLIALESGAFREGSERYGKLTHSWSWRPGGPVQAVSGGRAPPDPVLPHALPPQAIRCLAPLRTEMATGVSVGVGWERALVANPPTWVLVLEGFGACDASGWILLSADAPVTTLTVGGRPVSELDGATIHALAVDYLRQPRPYEDASALAAWDLLRTAPSDTLAAAVTAVAPGPFQERLWEELDQRDHAAALALAGQSASPVLRGAVTAEVESLRTASLTDPKAPADAVYAALTVWRPGPTDPPDILNRLRQSPSPRVRERAWELTLDATMAGCLERLKSVASADVTTASAVYRECPQQPVRTAAFQRVAALDRVAAGAMLNVVLEEPETLRTGVAAVRHTAAIERWDLLEALVQRPSVARDVRRVALEFLVRASVPQAAELVEQHGAYLGYDPGPAAGAPTGPATASEG
ncbi:MAG: hypothetical protein Q8P18_25330 [Pseudomonadota bacterium]|nr:hypothetical protein [Pseudomonadota bacterium]